MNALNILLIDDDIIDRKQILRQLNGSASNITVAMTGEDGLDKLRNTHYDVVLLDGRALEETGAMLVSHGLCELDVGLYFVCDAEMGARRTLGLASKTYQELREFEKIEVDTLMRQIEVRNHADRVRTVQPVKPPEQAQHWLLPNSIDYKASSQTTPVFYTVDTSADMSKAAMTQPVCRFLGSYLREK